MAGTRLWRSVGAGAVVLAAAGFAGAGSDDALVPSGWGIGSGPLAVGAPFYAGVILEAARGEPVHLLGADLVGIPDGMRVVGVYAVRRSEQGDDQAWIGSADDPTLRAHYPSLRLHPVADAMISGPVRDWYLLVEVEAARPGAFTSAGVRVAYESDGAFGEQVLPVVVTVTATTALPSRPSRG